MPYIFRPTSAVSLGSLWIVHENLTWLQYIVTLAAHAYLTFLCSAAYIYVGPFFFGFTVPYLVAIKELSLRKPGWVKSKQLQWLKSYRSLQVLSILFNEIFGPIMGGVKVLILTVIICGIACSIRIPGLISIALAAIASDAGIAAVMAFDFLAEFHRSSSKMLGNWKSTAILNKQKMLVQSVRSLQPLKFRLGSFYYVDKIMVFTLIEFIMSSIMSTLLLIPAE